MSYNTFPALSGIGWPIKVTPKFKTIVQQAASGAEYRTGLWSSALHQIEIPVNFMTQADRDTLANFFKQQLGALIPFNITPPPSVTFNASATPFGNPWNGTAASAQLVDSSGAALTSASVSAIHRTDWQGRQLLYPTARTNLCSYSQAFTSGNWAAQGSGTTITQGVTDPAGTATGATVANTTTGPSILYAAAADLGYAYPAGTQFAFSIWVKGAAGVTGYIVIAGNGLPSHTTNFAGTGNYQEISVNGVASSAGTYVNAAALLHAAGSMDVAFAMFVNGAVTGSYIATNNDHVTLTDYTLAGTSVNLAQAPASTATTNATFYAT